MNAVREPEHQRGVALFGGTFDPVHEGHLEVAQRAVESLKLDKVLFLPCRQSPHKSKATGASEEERLAMLRLATEGLPWAEVSDWEYQQPSPSYSWRTAEVFQEKFVDSRLYWLMGWDQWEVLPTWNRFEHLASLVAFIVHARDGIQGEFLQHSGAEVDFVAGNHPASSSKIRTAIERGGALPKGWLCSAVSDFIVDHSLYQE